MKLDIIKRHGRAAVGRQEVEMVSLNRWRWRRSTRETDEYKIFVDLFGVLFFIIKRNVVFGLRQRMGGDFVLRRKNDNFLSGEFRCREYLLIMF